MNTEPYSSFPQYSAGETAGRSRKAQLVRTLAAIIILIISTYVVSNIISVLLSLVYSGFGLDYGDSYIFDRLCDIVMYISYLGVPGCLYVLIRRITFRQCIAPGGMSGQKERVTVGTVLLYAAMAFALSCTMSYINSFFTFFAGLDSSVFAAPTAENLPGLVLDFVSIAILPALIEEFFFRGIILAELLPFGKSFAIVTSSFFFASVHGSIEQIAYSFVSGLVFALAAVKTGSLATGIVIHFLNNSYACILDYLSYKIPPEIFEPVTGVLHLAFVAAGLISIAYLAGKGRLGVEEEESDSSAVAFGVRHAFSVYLSPLMIGYCIMVLCETLLSYFVRM